MPLPCGGLREAKSHLLIEGDLLQEAQGLLGQGSLLGTDGLWAAQLQVVDEALAEGAPGVKQALQAPVANKLGSEPGKITSCRWYRVCLIRALSSSSIKCWPMALPDVM